MTEFVKDYKELRVYQNAIDVAMEIFQITKSFPAEEKYSMVDQMRRSSRSVCANLAEAWMKRRYRAAFIAKLSDAESEAAETKVWLDLAERCGYINGLKRDEIEQICTTVIGQIIIMINDADKWLIRAN
jgi:four helix bundle protein